jgi:hypothetical protein
VTSYRFLERYSKIAESSETALMLSQYILELSLIEVAINRWRPDLLACAAIYVSKKILKE